MLNGKTAVVTGASRGIGLAIALKMAENGANIAVIYAGNDQAVAQAVDQILQKGRAAKAYRCDVAEYDAVGALIKEIIADFDGFDILVNNAGVTCDKLMATMNEKDFDLVVDTNLKGSFNMIRHSCTHFIKKRSGRVINISSISGLMGLPGQTNYSASKAGIIGLTKACAKEFSARGITCNAIAPGFIETEMTELLSAETKENYTNMIPLRRMGTPDDVANLAVFLAGDSASYITGEVIKVDGGLYI